MAFLENVADWIRGFLSPEYSHYWIIILLAIAFVESSFFPTQLLFMMPPDVPLVIFAINKPEWAILFGLLCTLASVVGGSFGFFLGRMGGRPILRRFFAEEKIAAIDKLYEKYGVAAVGIAGFTPLPYIAFTLSAGAFRLDFLPFVLISLLSRGARFMAEAVFCRLWGDRFRNLLSRFNWWTFVVAFAVVLLAVLIRHMVRRSRKARRSAG